MAGVTEPHVTTTFSTLSTEMKQHIFTYLAYLDLKRCMRVCKDWKINIESPLFDAALFRGTNMKALSQSEVRERYSARNVESLVLHPALHKLAIVAQVKGTYDSHSDSEVEIRNFHFIPKAVAEEFAVMPPIQTAELCVSIAFDLGSRIFDKQNRSGITVRDVLNTVFTQQPLRTFEGTIPEYHDGVVRLNFLARRKMTGSRAPIRRRVKR